MQILFHYRKGNLVFLATCVCLAIQSCPTLGNPMDCNLPGSSVHGVSQARILDRLAVSSPRRSPRPRDQTCISLSSCIGRQTPHRSGKPHRLGHPCLQRASATWAQGRLEVLAACTFHGEIITGGRSKPHLPGCARLEQGARVELLVTLMWQGENGLLVVSQMPRAFAVLNEM